MVKKERQAVMVDSRFWVAAETALSLGLDVFTFSNGHKVDYSKKSFLDGTLSGIAVGDMPCVFIQSVSDNKIVVIGEAFQGEFKAAGASNE